MKKKLSGVLALILAATAAVSAAGCAQNNSGGSTSQSGSSGEEMTEFKDLLDGVEINDDTDGMIDEKKIDTVYTDFAVRFAQNADKTGESMFVSPISAAYGLELAANGAHGDTLTQIENTLGGSTFTMNRYFYFAVEGVSPGDSSGFKIGNSLWINSKNNFKPDDKTIKEIRTFYDASVFYGDFADIANDASAWLGKMGANPSAGYLPKESDSMYSLNSLEMTSQWKNAFDPKNSKKAKFTGIDGAQTDVDYLNGYGEKYIKDDSSEGFIKLFKGDCYGFAAILPNEGTSVEDYLKSMTGSGLTDMLKSAEEKNVGVSLPKIKEAYELSFKDVFVNMGVKDAFDSEKADFSSLGSFDGNLSLCDVVGESKISINENALNSDSAANGTLTAETDKQITLDRPFIYVIFDNNSYIPKYIGVYKKAGV